MNIPEEIQNDIELMCWACDQIAQNTSHPILKVIGNNADHKFWRHEKRFQSRELAIFLKFFKALTTSSACIKLVEDNFYGEAIALLRISNELSEDIYLLAKPELTGETYEDNTIQSRMLDSFYDPDIIEVDGNATIQKRGPDSVRRSKVRAEIGRLINPSDSSTMIENLARVDRLFSGAIHGSYDDIMDRFYKSHNRKNYSFVGLPDSPRRKTAIDQLEKNNDRLMNLTLCLAKLYGRIDVATRIEQRMDEIDNQNIS